jgi:hypothetical protein
MYVESAANPLWLDAERIGEPAYGPFEVKAHEPDRRCPEGYGAHDAHRPRLRPVCNSPTHPGLPFGFAGASVRGSACGALLAAL